MSDTFDRGLDLFRKHYEQYRKTGNEADKIAYESSKRWLDNYLSQLNTTIEQDRQKIETSVASYSTANPDLTSLSDKLRTIRTTAPKLQDDYITTKKRAEEVPVEDTTSYYAKAAIVVGLLGIAGAISAF